MNLRFDEAELIKDTSKEYDQRAMRAQVSSSTSEVFQGHARDGVSPPIL